MHRQSHAAYIAIFWGDEPQSGAIGGHGLRERLLTKFKRWAVGMDQAGATVLVDIPQSHAQRIYRFGDATGCAVGIFFRSAPTSTAEPQVIAFDDSDVDQISNTEGRHLIENFWGSYVAFVRLRARNGWLVLRDPGGQQQCYFRRFGNATVLFSRLSDLEALSETPCRPNWAYVGERLAFGAAPTRQTGVEHVSQVLPGEALVQTHEGIKSIIYWELPSIAAQAVTEEEARELLWHATRSAVHAWASVYPRILLLLSGGLDSAIVLACLKSAPNRPCVSALNQYSAGSDSDERRYARLAARQAGIPLAEMERDETASWAPLLQLGRSPVPYASIGTLQSAEQTSRLVAANGITAQFSGGGGDVLFYRHAGFLAAADALRIRPSLIGEQLLTAAYRDKTSIWKALGRSLYYGPLHGLYRMRVSPRLTRSLLGPAALMEIRESRLDLHPAIKMLSELPAGKCYQATTLLYSTCIHERPSGLPCSVPEVTPLLSQPLMESVARIPLFLLSAGGRDRSMARDVFGDLIPEEIARRQSKGGLEEYAKASLVRNIELIRELLLDGVLAKNGFLDRAGLLQVLSRDVSEAQTRVAELYDYSNIEAWLRGLQRG